MRFPNGIQVDGSAIVPDINVSTATSEAVNANILKAYVPDGSILPAGGTAGQVLTKSSNSDYAVSWQTVSADSQADIEELEAQMWFFL